MTRRRSSALVRGFLSVCVAALGLLYCLPAAAEASKSSPVGVWQTVDDKTGAPKSHVQIWERDGRVYGKILKLINPDEPDPLCTECRGRRKNQKVIGMVILWDMTKRDNGWWEGGQILDPENGKIYGCKLRVTGGGRKLEVRGFIGISLLGRTQHWNRIR